MLDLDGVLTLEYYRWMSAIRCSEPLALYEPGDLGEIYGEMAFGTRFRVEIEVAVQIVGSAHSTVSREEHVLSIMACEKIPSSEDVSEHTSRMLWLSKWLGRVL